MIKGLNDKDRMEIELTFGLQLRFSNKSIDFGTI